MKYRKALKIINIILIILISIIVVVANIFYNKKLPFLSYIFIGLIISIIIINISFIKPIKNERKKEYEISKQVFLSKLLDTKNQNFIGNAMYDFYTNSNEVFNELIKKYHLELQHNVKLHKDIYTLIIKARVNRTKYLTIELIYDGSFIIKVNKQIIDIIFNTYDEVVIYIKGVLISYEYQILEYIKKLEKMKTIEYKITIASFISSSLGWTLFFVFVVLAIMFSFLLFFLLLMAGELTAFLKFILIGGLVSVPFAVIGVIIGLISLIIAFIRKNDFVKNLSFSSILYSTISMMLMVLSMYFIYYIK